MADFQSPEKPKSGMDSLTTQEKHCFDLAMNHCLKEPNNLKIDVKKLAKLAGFTNKKSASNIWGSIKKKVFSKPANPTTPITTSSAPAVDKPASKKRDRTSNDAAETPTKRAKVEVMPVPPALMLGSTHSEEETNEILKKEAATENGEFMGFGDRFVPGDSLGDGEYEGEFVFSHKN
ncbi:uncharacterized protein KY384_005628 [Bacidia gigantensis]|uniref:uncharacterized protein n=1 Tax=Bacidia gigantensis TaxID=2732470 RepID=UPI001D05BD5A|nr:uncharacterized protein KY384_005628 [Bacidia gigantensis]KAG8530145.1 hypothetical protein KY384_005628 [Bacidia gigantensis]